MVPQSKAPLTILRRREVEARVGLKRSQLYQLMGAGKFPAAVRLGERAVGWVECEVNEWIAARIADSRAA